MPPSLRLLLFGLVLAGAGLAVLVLTCALAFWVAFAYGPGVALGVLVGLAVVTLGLAVWSLSQG
jgi:hypothetical protein